MQDHTMKEKTHEQTPEKRKYINNQRSLNFYILTDRIVVGSVNMNDGKEHERTQETNRPHEHKQEKRSHEHTQETKRHEHTQERRQPEHTQETSSHEHKRERRPPEHMQGRRRQEASSIVLSMVFVCLWAGCVTCASGMDMEREESLEVCIDFVSNCVFMYFLMYAYGLCVSLGWM
jgi:hypothetical protein